MTIVKRVARRASRHVIIEPIVGDVTDDSVAQRFVDCDYVILAADSMQARLVFNAIVHQYLISGSQVGAKVQVNRATGEILDVFSVARPLTPDLGCLWCNGLISASRLQEEALPEAERQRQRHVDEPDVVAPSVITLNAVAAAHGVDDFLFAMTGLLHQEAPHRWLRFVPRDAAVKFHIPRTEPACPECGDGPKGREGAGPSRRLPTRD